MVQVLLTDELRSSVGLFHHVVVKMGDLNLVHPALNLSILDAFIFLIIDNGSKSKFDDAQCGRWEGGIIFVVFR